MLKDEFGYCVACFFDPCRCFGGKDSESSCQQCRLVRDELTALRREVQRLRTEAAVERVSQGKLEHEQLNHRGVTKR